MKYYYTCWSIRIMSRLNCSPLSSNIAFHTLVTLALIFQSSFSVLTSFNVLLIIATCSTVSARWWWIKFSNMGLQPLEKNNDLARYIQKECKIELFSIQRVIPLRDDETNLELQATLVDTKLIACVFRSVLIQHAYLCVDRSDIRTASVPMCWSKWR